MKQFSVFHLFNRVKADGCRTPQGLPWYRHAGLLLGLLIFPVAFICIRITVFEPEEWGYTALVFMLFYGAYCVTLGWLSNKSMNQIVTFSLLLFILGLCLFMRLDSQVHVISCTTTSRYRSVVKETTLMVQQALSQSHLNPLLSKGNFSAIEPTIQFVRIQKTGFIKSNLPQKIINCADPQWRCMEMHNGATVAYQPAEIFPSRQTDAVIRLVIYPVSPSNEDQWFNRFPDEQQLKAVGLYWSPNGNYFTDATLPPNAHSNLRPYLRNPELPPDWFTKTLNQRQP